MIKKYLLFIFCSCCLQLVAQNKKILYGFDKIPQTLLLNPGAEVDYKYHIGVPMLSGISANLGSTGATVTDLFRDDGIPFNTKLNNVLNQVRADDYVYANTQLEVLNGGYQLNKRDYINGGFYAEVDAIAYIPKDMIDLVNKGNEAFLNRDFSFSQAVLKADVLGVLHAGITRKINKKITAGARLKIYSGALNVLTNENKGAFTTERSATNIYKHTIKDVAIGVYSSGIYNENDKVNISAGEIASNLFLGGSLGMGFDIGFTYHLSEREEITGSILDVGFISYSDKNRNVKIEGNYTFSGINFDGNKTSDYWNNLKKDVEEKVPRKENKESYSVMRPIKLNGSYKYKWGKSRNEATCSDMTYNGTYENAVGGQLYVVTRPLNAQFALTGFYERAFSNRFKTKFTYTIDNFSATNIGVGFSAKFWKINVYGMVDNIFKLSDIAAANTASFQIGLNTIFK